MARTKLFDEKHILDKAMDLFWLKGYHATSAQDLVDALEISRSSMYGTFGDKHSLFVKALTQYRRQRIDPVLKEANITEDVEGYIRSVFEAIKTDALNDCCSRGCFMVNSAVELALIDPEVAAITASIMSDFEDAISKAIEKGQKQGKFTTKQSALSLARFVSNSLNGLRVTVKFDSSEKRFDDVVNVCLLALKN
ncbi:TetR/AcrR family transcriptional regulator [Pontibacter silvestris]|uniref:TetR/AcrR family transcriptional regulator n=1 Tax=Pontibacter silvestris TaxID=2305183 RepID=A0ABW4X1D9_9BACT|nr:TetR/AcrR family transcriptional regulator [Pontibacter silvestris]MCC9138837.1 TetR/AcrR family transcriptional regulator [Pontibacter silvestris]